MSTIFVVHAQDERITEIQAALTQAGQQVLTCGDEPHDFTVNGTFVAVFSGAGAPPDWTEGCQIRIPVHPSLRPEHLAAQVPRWIKRTEERLSKTEVMEWRRRLKEEGFRPETTNSMVNSLERSPAKLDLNPDRLIPLLHRLAQFLAGGQFNLADGLETESVLGVMWRSFSGQTIQLSIPVCPAWSYNSGGYTFCGLQAGSCGVCYDMLAPILVSLTNFFRQEGLVWNLDIQVADVEWFDIATYRGAQSMTREVFMGRVTEQVDLIQEDLRARKLTGQVRTFLDVIPEQTYLDLRLLKRAEHAAKLGEESVRREFRHLLYTEAGLYAKQCQTSVNWDLPSTKVKEAALDDISNYLVYASHLAERVYSGQNLLFLVQADAFRTLYRPHAYLPWHSRAGF